MLAAASRYNAAMKINFSEFAENVRAETAFEVLAVARRLKSQGKEVVELEIGDSPFPSTPGAVEAGVAAIHAGHHRYVASVGIPEFRESASAWVNREYGLDTTAEHILPAPGAKPFELFFCETFLNPGDGVLVFSPYFPTYPPNIMRRGARMWLADLKQDREFRPNPEDVERFLKEDPSPKAIFVNSPHNPTGGVALEEDLAAICDLIRGRNVALFSDEPYDRLVWRGKHHTPLAFDGMMQQCVAAYTFSKSYSMSGWRIGFAVSDPSIIKKMGLLLNTTLSCVPPFVQLAAAAALANDSQERDRRMNIFQTYVQTLVAGLNEIEGFHCLEPGGTFYVFPNVARICNPLKITSHGLAMYLLEGADDKIGVACLGGECFGDAGAGFLRFSCAEPEEKLRKATKFVTDAITRGNRVAAYLESHPQYRLKTAYAEP